MPRYINVDSALQAHPEFLNEQIDDHDKAVYAKGWNACNSAYYDAIKEIDSVSPDEARGGTWVGIDDFPYESWECDRCGCVVENTDDPWNFFHYCPNCGAKMEVSDDE